jgi:hypothetical protein
VLTVIRTIRIDRPVAEVCAQFADVAHHERTGVHRGSRFAVLAETGDTCTYDQVTGRGPGRIRQRFELDRRDPAHLVNTVTDGAFQAGTLTFDIRATDTDASEVTATLAAPTRGLTGWLAPVLRVLLGRGLAQALEEDKRDLESGAYAATAT